MPKIRFFLGTSIMTSRKNRILESFIFRIATDFLFKSFLSVSLQKLFYIGFTIQNLASYLVVRHKSIVPVLL